MPNLSLEQINQYKKDGYIAPIDVLTKDEAEEVKKETEEYPKGGCQHPWGEREKRQ